MTTRRFNRYPSYKDSGVEWLGQIPAHWSVKRLKHLAAVNSETLPEDTDPTFEMSYVDIGGVDSLGRIVERERLTFASAPSRARRLVRDGDVIVSTVRTYLRAISPIRNPEPGMVVSTGFAVVRPHEGITTEFAAYALRAPYFIERVVANSKGVSFPAINESEMAAFELTTPAESEQRAIAAFLDRETGRVDELIAKKERLIYLLQEKRSSLIARTVTRGFDLNVPMKDSGVEWLREIPAHWHVKKIKWLFRQAKRQGHPNLTVLSVYRDFGVIEKSSRDDNFNRTPENLDLYQLVQPGDLVVNKMKAWQGSLGISSHGGITSPDYVVYSPRHTENERFLHHFLRNKILTNVYLAMSNGIRPSQWRIEPERFEELPVFIPPLPEQERIVLHLEGQTTRIDGLIAKVGEAIERLQESRATLISAAVTGKIDVRKEV